MSSLQKEDLDEYIHIGNQRKHCLRHTKVKFVMTDKKLRALLKKKSCGKIKFSNPIFSSLGAPTILDAEKGINFDAKCPPSFYNISIGHKPQIMDLAKC